MAVKPSNTAEWGTGAAPVTEPLLAEKQAGWPVAFKPPAQWFNWWMREVHRWVLWLDAFETDPHTWVGLQTFASANVTTLGAGTIAATGPSTFADTVSITGVLTAVARAVFNGGVSLVSTSSVEAASLTDSSTTRKLLFKVQVNASPAVFARLYTAPLVAGTAGFGGGFEFVYNASWTGATWSRDSASFNSTRIVIGHGIQIFAGSANNPALALIGARDDVGYGPGAFYNGNTARDMLLIDGAGTLRVGREQVQDAFTTITLSANNSPLVGQTPRAFRDSMGVAHLSGQSQVVTGFAGGTQVATLPTGCFPDRYLELPYVQDLAGVTKYYVLSIDVTGVVALRHLSGGAALVAGEVVQFENITFKAA